METVYVADLSNDKRHCDHCAFPRNIGRARKRCTRPVVFSVGPITSYGEHEDAVYLRCEDHLTDAVISMFNAARAVA